MLRDQRGPDQRSKVAQGTVSDRFPLHDLSAVMADWHEHCPLDPDEARPVELHAWKDGWEYCMEHGPGAPDHGDRERTDLFARPALLSLWLQGYSAADNHLREQAS